MGGACLPGVDPGVCQTRTRSVWVGDVISDELMIMRCRVSTQQVWREGRRSTDHGPRTRHGWWLHLRTAPTAGRPGIRLRRFCVHVTRTRVTRARRQDETKGESRRSYASRQLNTSLDWTALVGSRTSTTAMAFLSL